METFKCKIRRASSENIYLSNVYAMNQWPWLKIHRKAIDSGVYEIDEDISEMHSDFDLKEAMLQDKHPTLICEIKYASPSAGRIRDL